MIPLLSPRLIRRRGRRALRRITPRQREIFRAYCANQRDYDRLAGLFRTSVDEVRADLVFALLALNSEFEKPVRWWERLLPF